jgi:DNA gyrase subunit A
MSDINKREITSELQEAYLDYAMSVIVSRALPDIRDGLKPVHRRILWAMWESGNTAGAKLRKSANVVGLTMGKYHPHGDMAIYDTLVRMAQDFSLRYPLVQGQGNFGSIDGDSAAAMRYTEVRLGRISDEMLSDIEKETVDWAPNYDATIEEPKVLPAKLPNLILNGSLGIAVGMATSIPPHNLREVAAAILHLAEHPDATTNDLMDFVKGPDFPTGGLMFDEKAIREAYASGRGAVLTRGKAEVEERKNRQFDIVITEIPYQVNKSELILHMAELVTSKKIEGVRDIRDESDREGLRIVVELKNDVPPQKILNQLYQYTDLQKNFNLNMIGLVNGIEPRLLSLKDMLAAYLDYRKIVIRRRTEFDLRKAEERAHILQSLAALERQKIEEELKEKKALIKDLQLILKNPARIVKIITDEVAELTKKYGDDRRTQLVSSGVTEFKDEDLIPQEEAVITLSGAGYVKRLPPTSFKSQGRGGKGLIGSDVAEEDFLTHFLAASTHDNILFFTDKGRVFQTKVYEIPAASRTSKGRAIHNFLEMPTDETVSAIVTYPETKKKQAAALIMVTKQGVIKKTTLEDFRNIRRTGIIAIALHRSDALIGVHLSEEGACDVILTTAKGQSIRFKESQVREMGRTAAGVRAIKLRSGDTVTGFDLITKQEGKENRLLVVMANGFGKQTPLKEYKAQSRGGSGIRTANITAKTGALIAARTVSDQTDIIALSAKGQVIRIKLESVRMTGRAAQGVRIMDLRPGDRLAGVVII